MSTSGDVPARRGSTCSIHGIQSHSQFTLAIAIGLSVQYFMMNHVHT